MNFLDGEIYIYEKSFLCLEDISRQRGSRSKAAKAKLLTRSKFQQSTIPNHQASVFFSPVMRGGLERAAPKIMCVKLLSERTSDQLSFIVIEKISFSFLGLRGTATAWKAK